MSKKSRADRNFKFEHYSYMLVRKQQMQLQMQEQFLFTRHHLMYSTIHSMPLTDLVLRMQVIFMEDLQILQRMFSRKE